MARPRGAWWMAGLVVPLVLAGLILMHGVDAGAVESMTGATHGAGYMVAADTHADGVSSSDHGCDECRFADHITVACVTVLASIALWCIRPGRPRTTDATSPPSAASARPPRLAVPRWRPPWIDLCVIVR